MNWSHDPKQGRIVESCGTSSKPLELAETVAQIGAIRDHEFMLILKLDHLQTVSMGWYGSKLLTPQLILTGGPHYPKFDPHGHTHMGLSEKRAALNPWFSHHFPYWIGNLREHPTFTHTHTCAMVKTGDVLYIQYIYII